MRRNKIDNYRRRFQVAGVFIFMSVAFIVFIIGVCTNTGHAKVKDEEIKVIEVTTQKIGAPQPGAVSYYNVPLTNDLQEYIFTLAARYNLPADLIIAVIEAESNYDQYTVGACGEQGYMQINPMNNEWLTAKLGITNFYDARQNILCGVYILSDYYNRYDSSEAALMCYSCGEAGAHSLWENGITTNDYVQKVNRALGALTTR